MENMLVVLVIVGIVVIALVTVGMIFARLYRRSTKEVSFVRTGFGGQKVVVNGGALVLPVLHETISVNMNTLCLAVKRGDKDALITRDRMRVNVAAEFYVRVQPTVDSIANAAQTLGLKTMRPETLKELVEAKFVDALRSVAAEMAMEELHEQRTEFVQKVQKVVSGDILKNGLELESVSLTGLDQTAKEHLNPNNVFDAEGLLKTTEAIELRRKKRNEIEQTTAVEIKTKNLEATKQSLDITRDEEYAKLTQEREISVRKAAQLAEIALVEAEKQKEAEVAKVKAQQEIEMEKLNTARAVQEGEIALARALKEKEIEKEKVVEAQEIEKQKLLEEKGIEKARSVESALVEKQKAVELAEQEKSIAVAEKSREQSEAQAAAAKAKAEAAKEEEKVITAREVEKAERSKQVEIVEAKKKAERDALALTIGAEAQKKASLDKAEAVKTDASAEAAKVKIVAEGEAEAEKTKAEAAKIRYQVEAEGKEKLNEADNKLSAEQVGMRLRLALLNHLPQIIKESVQPLNNIESIKVVDVSGFGQGSNGGSEGKAAGDENLADKIVNSALRYRTQAPLVDQLMEEVGIKGTDLNGLTAPLRDTAKRVAAAQPAPAAKN